MNPPSRISLRRAASGAVAGLVAVGALAASGPAVAAPITDGTSNTLQLAVTSATLDQAHHRVLATSAAPLQLRPGTHLASLEINAPDGRLVLTDVMIESITGTDSPAPNTQLSVKYTLFLPS
jgi:hypothetical protein